MRVLICEDDATSSMILQKALKSAGYQVAAAQDGATGLKMLRKVPFDAVLTDWMMPRMDGIALIQKVRAEFDDPPPLLMLTALNSDEARKHALAAGADEYLAKPYSQKDILERLEACIGRSQQAAPTPKKFAPPKLEAVAPPKTKSDFVGVAFAGSTGAPEALLRILVDLDPEVPAAYFVALHGPSWVLQTFVEQAASLAPLPVRLATHWTKIEPGTVTVSPGDVHMVVDPKAKSVRLLVDPPVNFVRPAADPLFKSLAAAFGNMSIAVVLSGVGQDGSVGAQHIRMAGGRVIVQDPASATAPQMPRNVVGLRAASQVVALEEIGGAIDRHVDELQNGIEFTDDEASEESEATDGAANEESADDGTAASAEPAEEPAEATAEEASGDAGEAATESADEETTEEPEPAEA